MVYIYNGHNDNSPANALAASTNDNDGYDGTGNSGTSSQKRTLKLSNNQVIWDLAGNVNEWTQGTISGAQPGPIDATELAYRNYNSFPEAYLGNANPNILPSYGTPQAIDWNNTNGIGQLYSNPSEMGLRAFGRGGLWSNGSAAGVFRLSLSISPSDTSSGFGFRASWEP